MSIERVYGTVKIWNFARAFGWCLVDDSRVSAFVHINDVRGKYHLQVNDRICFRLIEAKRGAKAIDAVIMSPTTADAGARDE